MSEVFQATPPRVTLTNLVSMEKLSAQWNPTEFSEDVGAEYARHKVQGLSHEIMQFANSKNDVLEMEFYWSASDGPQALSELHRARAFLRSMCRPRGGLVGTIKSGGAPTCLLVWPGTLSLETKITAVKMHHKRFNKNGATVYLSAKVTFERSQDMFVSSEQVFEGDDV